MEELSSYEGHLTLVWKDEKELTDGGMWRDKRYSRYKLSDEEKNNNV